MGRLRFLTPFLTRAELLVIDESMGRKAAADRGLSVNGTIGVLEAAADRGMVRLEVEFERLKGVRFWVSPELLQARLALFRQRQAEKRAQAEE
jgi:predicted nucleic acid-binding protein